jgi:hypothetical protein
VRVSGNAGIAQLVEHVIGNDEVISSNLITSSREACCGSSKPLFGFSALCAELPAVSKRLSRFLPGLGTYKMKQQGRDKQKKA